MTRKLLLNTVDSRFNNAVGQYSNVGTKIIFLSEFGPGDGAIIELKFAERCILPVGIYDERSILSSWIFESCI